MSCPDWEREDILILWTNNPYRPFEVNPPAHRQTAEIPFDRVVMHAFFFYEPRNKHYRRKFDMRLVSWPIAMLIGAAIWYAVLRITGLWRLLLKLLGLL
jgi:hypothetical protein